jgi:hypothetical protein
MQQASFSTHAFNHFLLGSEVFLIPPLNFRRLAYNLRSIVSLRTKPKQLHL